MFEPFVIFKNNWKKIRDEVLSIGFDKFQKHPQCKPGTEVRIVPRNVYDQITKDSTL